MSDHKDRKDLDVGEEVHVGDEELPRDSAAEHEAGQDTGATSQVDGNDDPRGSETATEADVEDREDQEIESSAEVKRISELEGKMAEAREQVLRALAESENARKRAARDVITARKNALKDFARNLIAVADNFDRTVRAIGELSDEEAQVPLLVGLELTIKEFTSTLNSAGINAFHPQDEKFDPQLHEAVALVPSADVEPNTVIEVMRCGYFLNEDLLRAAQVVVAQQPKTPSADEAEQ